MKQTTKNQTTDFYAAIIKLAEANIRLAEVQMKEAEAHRVLAQNQLRLVLLLKKQMAKEWGLACVSKCSVGIKPLCFDHLGEQRN
jgi:hypothetical protein